MGMATRLSLLLFTACARAVLAANFSDGKWKLAYPPWGEAEAPMTGKPEVFIPIMGPLTGHSCMPSRYIAQRVAVSHLNRRDATFCPAIAQLRNDFEVKYALQDSHASGSGAVVAAMKLMESDTTSGRTVGSREAKVKVVLGPNSSPEAAGVHPFLGGAFSIPYLSWAATMGALGNKEVYKYFFRVVAPDSVTMGVQAGFIHWLGYQRVNILYVDDQALSFGQAEDFSTAASVNYGMQVLKYAISRSGSSAGAPMNDVAKAQTKAHMAAIEATKTRVIGVYGIGMEVRDIFAIANSMNMARGPGWLWFGGDGFAGTMLTGAAAEDEVTLQIMSGTIYVLTGASTPEWEGFTEAWRAEMVNMSTPEFTQQSLCFGGEVCESRSDFSGLDAEGNRCLNSWLQEAYVSMVSMAVAADRLMTSTGRLPQDFDKEDWFNGLKTFETESFQCLSGRMQLSPKQQRAADVSFFQWQKGVAAPVRVATWDATNEFGWVPGIRVVFSDDREAVVSSRNDSLALPTGRPPVCPHGQAYDQQELRCRECDTGYVALMVDDVAVCTCAAGYGMDAATEVCMPCAEGTAKAGPGGQACAECGEGFFSELRGATACKPCPKGTFAPTMGSSGCTACGTGYTTQLASSTNRSDCTCDEDFYGTGGSCQPCPSGSMTDGIAKESAAHCFCQQGFYKPKDSPLECLPCREGMVCSSEVGNRVFGSVQRGGPLPEGYDMEPRLEEFYWADKEDTLLVFRCSSRERCPGGLPGDATACSSTLFGRACTECQDSKHWNGRICETCAWFDASILVFPVMPVFLGPLIVLLLYKMFGDTYEKWNSAQNGCASTAFVLLNHYQIVYILAGADVPFTTETSSFMSSFSFSHDISTPFNLECRGYRGLQYGLLIRGVGPVLVAMVFAGTWGFSHLLARATKRADWKMEVNRTLNGFFSLMLTFFAGIVEMALMLFKCGSNTKENGLSTLMADRSVICFQDEWRGMLGIGISAVVLWVIGFGALFVRTVIMAPTWFHDPAAQMRWKFLFIKYRPDVHWWALTFVGKGLLMNLVFVFFDTGVTQIYSVITISLLYCFAVIVCMPWRHTAVNYVDVWLHQCIMQVCGVLLWFSKGRDNDWAEVVMNKVLIGFGVLGVPASCAVVLYLFWSKFSRIAVAAKDEEKHRVWAAVVEVASGGEEQFMIFMNSLSDWDFYCLTAAMRVLVTDFFGLRVRSGLTVQKPVARNIERLLQSGFFEKEKSTRGLDLTPILEAQAEPAPAAAPESPQPVQQWEIWEPVEPEPVAPAPTEAEGPVDVPLFGPGGQCWQQPRAVAPLGEQPIIEAREPVVRDDQPAGAEERTRQLTARPGAGASGLQQTRGFSRGQSRVIPDKAAGGSAWGQNVKLAMQH